MRQYYHDMQAAIISERITFPPFQLDLSAGRLSRQSRPVDLPPKAFAVLRYLAERSGQLVSKEELLGSVWAGVHVSPDVLKVTIAEIRRLLADSCKQPRIIETVQGRGYRSIAPTQAATHGPAVEAGILPTRYARPAPRPDSGACLTFAWGQLKASRQHLLTSEPVILSSEDRNRMSRLYEEVRIRLEEMAIITTRTLKMNAGGRAEVKFCPGVPEVDFEAEAVELIRTLHACFELDGAGSEACPANEEN